MTHYSLLGYTVVCAFILLITTGEYRLLMENKVKPSINRKILLFILMISIGLPFFIALMPDSSMIANMGNEEPVAGGIVSDVMVYMIHDNSEFHYYPIYTWVRWIYIAGIIIIFLYSAFAVTRLILLMKQSTVRELKGVKVFIHNAKNLSSFSWLNNIFLYNESVDKSKSELEILINHELAHLNKGHWLDLAFAQIVLIFQWFNPAIWFIRRELQRIHEYEADEIVLSSGIERKEYQMLLIRNISRNRFTGLTDGLNNCSLKKRIIMMKKTDFKTDWVKRVIVLGVSLIFIGMIINLPAVASILKKPQVDKENMESMPKYQNAYIEVDKVAEYEGGQNQLLKDLIETMDYPEEAKNNGIQGNVIVRFRINADGSLSDCEVANSNYPVLDNAAIKAVEGLPGKWLPAEIAGKPVASLLNMPITFKLSSDSSKNK